MRGVEAFDDCGLLLIVELEAVVTGFLDPFAFEELLLATAGKEPALGSATLVVERTDVLVGALFEEEGVLFGVEFEVGLLGVEVIAGFGLDVEFKVDEIAVLFELGVVFLTGLAEEIEGLLGVELELVATLAFDGVELGTVGFLTVEEEGVTEEDEILEGV